MPAPIVTSTYRYKRPPRKRKAVPLEVPAIVRRGTPKPETPPAPANDDRKPVSSEPAPVARANDARKSAIVTVKKRSSKFGDVPDMALEEHRRRGDAADTLFHEIVRRATE